MSYSHKSSNRLNDPDSVWLIAKGKNAGLNTKALPNVLVYITGNQPLYGFVAFDAYKGDGFDGCWYFVFHKVNDSLYEGIISPPLVAYTKCDLETISLLKHKNGWIYTTTSSSGAYPLQFDQHLNVNAPVLKKAYIEAIYEVWSLYFEAPFIKAAHPYYFNTDSFVVQTDLQNKDLTQSVRFVNQLSLSDFLKYSQGVKSNISKKECVFMKTGLYGNGSSEVIDQQKLYKLFQTLTPCITPPNNFKPSIIIECKYQTHNCKIEYLVDGHYLKVDSYCFKSDKNISAEINLMTN